MKATLLAVSFIFFAFCVQAHDGVKKIKVVASFSIVGDMVKQVAGDEVELKILVGPDGDAHVYQPTPEDVKAVAAADIVIVNGLGFEGWLDRLVEASASAATVVTVSKGAQLIEMSEDGHDEHDDHHHDAEHDPHAWQNVANALIYVNNIRNALVKADATHATTYEKNANAYIQTLEALHLWVKEKIQKIPAEKRKVITSHDSFQYYAKAYGVTFLAPMGMNAQSEPSAKALAALIDQIRTLNITALFIENISDPRIIEQLAKDGGTTLGGTLYSDALSGEKGPALTYIDMMKHNTSLLVKAMQNNP